MARTIGALSKYKRVEELRPHIADFKEYYYQCMLKEAASNPKTILDKFNEDRPELGFWPKAPQYRRWQQLWNVDVNAKRSMANLAPIVSKQLINTRDQHDELLAAPPIADIEEGTRTLAGELMNDAMGMLKEDQKRGDELYTDDVLLKRKKYVLNVYNFVSRNVMSAEALKLKQQANVRENTNFLMDLLRRSTAGKISSEEMALLRSSTKIKTDEPSHVGQNPQSFSGVDAA